MAILADPIFAASIHAVNGILAFGAALGISSIGYLNKGARVNMAWGLAAVGLILIGIAQGNLFLAGIALPNLSAWADLMTGAGLLLILAGILDARGLLKKMLK